MKPTFLSLSRRIGTNIALLCLCVAVSAQVYLDASAPMEQRVEDALARMTLQEKIALIHAQSKFSSPGVALLGIP